MISDYFRSFFFTSNWYYLLNRHDRNVIQLKQNRVIGTTTVNYGDDRVSTDDTWNAPFLVPIRRGTPVPGDKIEGDDLISLKQSLTRQGLRIITPDDELIYDDEGGCMIQAEPIWPEFITLDIEDDLEIFQKKGIQE